LVAGWCLFCAGPTHFAIIKRKAVEGWARVSSGRIRPELDTVARGQYDFERLEPLLLPQDSNLRTRRLISNRGRTGDPPSQHRVSNMCCAIAKMPNPHEVRPDTPLRLEIAAALAFPDGSMTASGLRREGARGRLVIERIAGKDYTTIANIERMRQLCRVQAKAHDSISVDHAQASGAKPSGLSATGNTISPRAALEARLTKGLRKMPSEH
jgi:hypothetical protein